MSMYSGTLTTQGQGQVIRPGLIQILEEILQMDKAIFEELEQLRLRLEPYSIPSDIKPPATDQRKDPSMVHAKISELTDRLTADRAQIMNKVIEIRANLEI